MMTLIQHFTEDTPQIREQTVDRLKKQVRQSLNILKPQVAEMEEFLAE